MLLLVFVLRMLAGVLVCIDSFDLLLGFGIITFLVGFVFFVYD